MHGFCFQIKQDGSTFEGLYKMGKREGFGKETFGHLPTEDWKEGVWTDGELKLDNIWQQSQMNYSRQTSYLNKIIK